MEERKELSSLEWTFMAFLLAALIAFYWPQLQQYFTQKNKTEKTKGEPYFKVPKKPFLIAIEGDESEKDIWGNTLLQEEKHQENYAAFLLKHQKKQKDFQEKWKKVDDKEAIEKMVNDYLHQTLSTDFYYFWKETGWDFNGHTERPRDGAIACGFFVTTLLDHAGFRIKRISLAQQASLVMIKQLCKAGSVKGIAGFDRFKTHMEKQTDGIYIVGLDFHTGFIIKEKETIYFMHSDYINRRGVIKENITASAALKASKNFHVGDLLGNKRLIKKWCNN